MALLSTRLGVLVSGRGSNLGAILQAIDEGRLCATVAAVVSDHRDAGALARVSGRKECAVFVVERGAYPQQGEFEDKIAECLEGERVDLVVLAGFMRVLSGPFVRRFAGRIINIHPSLLPSFPGLHAQRQALLHGVKVAGCTVHMVDETLDGGQILAQAAVPVLPDDTEETLSARILAEEHRILPETIARVFTT
ncbi:MAG: phosphoribosylglycinamide formyltransferase [Synergistaceae bacterium]|jgi:phosphoribosylglycinamide formyltransferase-1|nr:phosphoribosylglycinamide formyltransferase [Synergistaceae bacterium]